MSDVMQDSGSDDGIAPGKINEWRAMLLRHTKRATLGTVVIPDPEAKDGWVERDMLSVVLEAERDRIREFERQTETRLAETLRDLPAYIDARQLVEDALPLARRNIMGLSPGSEQDSAVEVVRRMVNFLKGPSRG